MSVLIWVVSFFRGFKSLLQSVHVILSSERQKKKKKKKLLIPKQRGWDVYVPVRNLRMCQRSIFE